MSLDKTKMYPAVCVWVWVSVGVGALCVEPDICSFKPDKLTKPTREQINYI